MRVLKGLVVSLNSRMPLVEKPLVLSAAWGGERQNNSVGFNMGYSETARSIGARSYLEPNRNTLQKPIGGLSALASSATISTMKNHERFHKKRRKQSED